MRRIPAAVAVCLTLCALAIAQANTPDGYDEILAVVNGQAITYQEVVGNEDLQPEINAARAMLPPSMTDADIERELVFQRLQSYVMQKLLDAEADRVQLKITDAQMRAIINGERRKLGLDERDAKGWARYLKEKFNLTPSEYREKVRGDIRRNEIWNYMAGLYGPLPPQYPLEVYFSLSVSPAEVRKDFESDPERWRVAQNIDFREFRLVYPVERISQADKIKLLTAVVEGDESVHERVLKNESLEKASEELQILIDQLGVPGVRMELTERKTAADDTELDAMSYQLVLQVAEKGGVSEVAAFDDTDDDGQRLEGVKFVIVYGWTRGDRRAFESPQVQEAIRRRIENVRLVQNRTKVEKALLKRAAIVPERLIAR
jgi:hypothetical protein